MALKKCCCCSLKTGSLVVATLGWILTLIKLFVIAGNMTTSSEHQEKNSNNFFAYQISYSVLSLCFTVLLVVGIYKEKRFFMIPWLVMDCLECIVFSLGIFIIFIPIFMVSDHFILILIFILSCLIAILCWYCWVVVLSHCLELRDATLQQLPNAYYSPTSAPLNSYGKDHPTPA